MTERRLVLTAEIDTGDRLRDLDVAWGAALRESIRDQGQQQPILIRPHPDSESGFPFKLVYGLHRHWAVGGLTGMVDAEIRALSEDEARLSEIDENLMRRELNPLDRAVFMAERKAVYERMYPESAHGKAKKSKRNQDDGKVANIATFARFSKDAAKSTGLSERSVQIACQIYAELGPEAITALRATPLAGNQAQLLLLARMAPAEREAAITAAVAAKSTTVSAALRSVGLGRPAPNADEETYRKLCELWDRAGAKARRRFIARIGLGDDADDDATAVA